MSYQTGTTHYNLPQTAGTDKRDWADTNQAFADVDAALYGAATAASAATTDIGTLNTKVGTLETKMSSAETAITALEASDTQQDTSILALQTDKQDKTDNNLNTTAKTIVGSINEVFTGSIQTAVVSNVEVTPSNGFGHATFDYTVPSGFYVIGASVERVDGGSYDVVASADPFTKRIAIACPASITGQLTFNIVVIFKKASN